LSAASIYPFNKSHSTHTTMWWNWGNGLYHRRRRWHGLRLCMVILCPNTHRYMHIIVCEALMCCCCRCRLVVCVCVCVCFVWGCCPHTRYSGLCCCLAAAAPLHREAAVHGMRSIQLCRVCAWTRSHISGVCVCVCVCLAHTHTHTPTPPPTLSNTRTCMHMSSRACIPKVICICV
jgi:hypothetical protein